MMDAQDRDLLIRTVIGEANGEPEEGQAAVAHSILNRLAAGSYGKSVRDVVLAPGQYEPWQTRAGELSGYSPNSEAYQSAAKIVDGVLAGQIPDPTDGATHFLNPQTVLQRSGRVPDWSMKGDPIRIGRHVFNAPNGASSPPINLNGTPADLSGAGVEPLAYAGQGAAVPQPKASSAPSDEEFLKQWGVPPKSKEAAPAPAQAPAAQGGSSDEDFLRQWGVPPKADGKTEASPSKNMGQQGAGDQQGIAFGAGLANGIPVAGPYILGGLEKAAAGVNALTNNSRFSDELEAVKNRLESANEAHPYASTAGTITGAVGGTLPLGATALGARALGMSGPTMLSRMAVGAAGSGALGGLDAAARGEDPVVGGAFGAAGGALGPVVGKAIGAGANKVIDATNYMLPTGVSDMSRSSANILGHVIAADDPAAIRATLVQHGPDAMLADAGPSTTGLTGALALKPSDAKTVVTNALTERANGATDRIASQLDASLGPARDPELANRALQAMRDKVNQGYKAVHADAPDVDISSVVDAIDTSLKTATGAQKTALQNIKNTLIRSPEKLDEAGNVIEPAKYVTNSETLHNLRQDIDAVVNYGSPGLGVEKGAVARTQGSLKSVRGNLDAALKDQVPGMADVDARSAAIAKQQEAVDRGFNDILGSKGPHPDTYAVDRAAQPPAVNTAENIGMRGRIDRMFGTGTQRDAVTLNKLLAGGEDGYAAANLKTAFGTDKVNALLDTLNREKLFANTTNEVLQNSATARRTAAGKLLEDTQPGGTNVMNASLAGMAAQAGKSMVVDPLVRMIMESPNASRNLEIAKALTAQGASRDQILDQILRLNSRNSAVAAFGSKAQNALSSGTNRLFLGAAPAYNADQQRP